MYAMTAAHPTLPLPSYARVTNVATGKSVVVRVNDRGPFSPGRVIDLSYTAALKLGVLNGVAQVEISRITEDDIRTGAAFRKPTVLAGTSTPGPSSSSSVVKPVAPTSGDVTGIAAPGVDAGVLAATQSPMSSPGVDLGVAAAADAAPTPPGTVTTVTRTVSSVVAAVAPATPARADKPDEHARADTTAGAGYWIQLGAYRQRDGALDFQHRLIDEQPWLAPLLAVFSDHGLNKLQAGPYTSRDDARSAAERIRTALQLVPTIVEKR
jgi:rare lipoprotein A